MSNPINLSSDSNNIVFITGTGTGVGKTLISGALLKAGLNAKIKVKYFKPIESGVEKINESDAGMLAAFVGQDLHETCPIRLAIPLAPMIAARLEGVEVSLETLDGYFHQAKKEANLLLIEGAGGLTVPICSTELGDRDIVTCAGIARRWKAPLVIVADADLGMLNHTVLTVEQARREGLKILGIIINNYPEVWTPNEFQKTAVGIKLKSPFTPPIGIDRLIERPLDTNGLNEVLEKISPEAASSAALSNPAVLSFLTQLPILAIVPHFKDCEFPRLFSQATPYVEHLFPKPTIG